METRETLLSFIEAEFVNGTGAASLGYDDDLLLSGLINSLGVMRLVAFVQSEFNISIPYEDITIENFETVNAIDAYLKTQQPQA